MANSLIYILMIAIIFTMPIEAQNSKMVPFNRALAHPDSSQRRLAMMDTLQQMQDYNKLANEMAPYPEMPKELKGAKPSPELLNVKREYDKQRDNANLKREALKAGFPAWAATDPATIPLGRLMLAKAWQQHYDKGGEPPTDEWYGK